MAYVAWMRYPTGETEARFQARLAQGWTAEDGVQVVLARELGVTRARIGQLVARARRQGLLVPRELSRPKASAQQPRQGHCVCCQQMFQRRGGQIWCSVSCRNKGYRFIYGRSPYRWPASSPMGQYERSYQEIVCGRCAGGFRRARPVGRRPRFCDRCLSRKCSNIRL